MVARQFTYTEPSSIEGEPAEVAAIAIQQVQALAAVVAKLSTETFVQLRAAGIDPDNDDAVKAWLDTPEGKRASELVWGAQAYVEVTQQL